MYRHIVMIRLRVLSDDTLARMEEALRAQMEGAHGLLSMEVERDARGDPDACHLCVNLLFDGRASLDAYRENPARAAIIAQTDPLVAQTTTAEYPVTRPVRKMPRLYAVLGPASRDRETLGRLLDAGMSGIRVGMEHQSIEDVLRLLEVLHDACASCSIDCEVLLDPYPSPRLSEAMRRTGATGLILSTPETEGTLRDLRALLGPSVRLLCKVDCAEHIQALPHTLRHADEVIIARSGMGRKLPRHALPKAQRQVAVACRAAGTPFMIATDLLLTMRDRPFPSAAELGDIHTAVHEGAASLMLNDEVAVGRYPVEAMEMLRRTAEAALTP